MVELRVEVEGHSGFVGPYLAAARCLSRREQDQASGPFFNSVAHYRRHHASRHIWLAESGTLCAASVLYAGEMPPMDAAVSSLHRSVPIPRTRLIGREAERFTVRALLLDEAVPLLTVTGPGGVGKTRLALEVLREVRERYRNGVFFVPLEALSTAGSLATSIAGALGVKLQGQEDVLTQLIRHLRDKALLIVLDNYEHLLEGVTVVSSLVKTCSHLKLLVTSRERLNLQEEWLLPLVGLSYFQTESIEEAITAPAVKLFVERAKQVKPDFLLTEEELPGVLKICSLVEGSPLAIELAAVWVKLLSYSEIVQEIDMSLDFLASARRNVPERHKSMRAVFEHSWRLLTLREQEVLRKLSVFRGGFRAEAAKVVSGASLAVLRNLIDKSLLRVTAQGRYDSHPLLNQYTREKLAVDLEEQARVNERQGKYYLHLLQEWGGELHGPKQKPALEAIEEELENIRLAWQWATAQARVQELAHAAEPLRKFFEIKGRILEGRDLFAETAAVLSEADPNHHAVLGQVLVNEARCYARFGDMEKASELAQAGLRLLRPWKDSMIAIYGLGLGVLAYNARYRGAYEEAKGYSQEVLDLARKQQDHSTMAGCLCDLGVMTEKQGHYEEARQHVREALRLYQELGDYRGISWSLGFLGLILLRLGKLEAAQALLQRALEIAEESGERTWVPLFLTHLGCTCYEGRDYSQARSFFRQALGMLEETQWQGLACHVLADLARVETALENYQEARDTFFQSLRLTSILHLIAPALDALAGLVALHLKQGQVARALELAGLVLEHPATEHVHRVFVQRLIAEVEEAVTQEEVATALERGKSLPLEDIVRNYMEAFAPM